MSATRGISLFWPSMTCWKSTPTNSRGTAARTESSIETSESATAQPQATMFGEYRHADIAEMAAAYLSHFAAAQGFVDGNKRTAAGAATVFLARNGYMLDLS